MIDKKVSFHKNNGYIPLAIIYIGVKKGIAAEFELSFVVMEQIFQI